MQAETGEILPRLENHMGPDRSSYDCIRKARVIQEDSCIVEVDTKLMADEMYGRSMFAIDIMY